MKDFIELFGDDYYIELQRHDGLEKDLKPLNEELLKLSRKFGVPLIATNDVHYVRADDARAQDALLAIQTRTTLDDKNRFTMIDSPTYYLKSQEEMSDLFSDLPEAITNTRKIVDKVDLTIPTGKMIYPKFPTPEGMTPNPSLSSSSTKRSRLATPTRARRLWSASITSSRSSVAKATPPTSSSLKTSSTGPRVMASASALAVVVPPEPLSPISYASRL